MTAGELTLEAACAWDMVCCQYFMHKAVPNDEQVKKVAWGMQDVCIKTELRSNWLPADWTAIVRKRILNSTQGWCPFFEWAIECQFQNFLLCNTTSHLSNVLLKHQLEANMLDNLTLDCCHDKINDEKDLAKWIDTVKQLNDKRLIALACQQEAMDTAIRAEKAA
ncbi:hypothetical protein SERLA73DRAFT_68208 [Serpula lacrymans var. lacrymans S7.3]|uniref:Uncharacterized protein n=2 Tax=Serpula lacrymans var. lacrymans TaxID=341189 RepID=F8PHJ3_SERL3|nr:uncharacterized protein SERLADRAFT_431942 [Serpula lacrymans var. lacrymans S7.9]EGO04525.1 hypothetical protein SERLA73DRAFT_68208 [Serpula lacrymans var. lacrymans S7.3]EGO30406.1 hypothetical protein SERLADRAFT_431942 [Serpula lacrymans var. lacrymans S7.9]